MEGWDLPELASLADDEVDALIATLTEDERCLSRRRDELHAAIDALVDERVDRLRVLIAAGEEVVPDPRDLADAVARCDPTRSKRRRSRPLPPSPLPTFSPLSDQELRALWDDLDAEDDRLSRERRRLHWLIDALHSWRELVGEPEG